MARVRLRVWENNPSLQLPAGDASLPFLRVVATVLFGLDPPPGEVVHRYDATAAIDTGAPFSIIKCGTWELYERLGLLERLGVPNGAALLNIAGSQCGYELGRVWVGVADADFRSRPQLPVLPAVPVIFQLLTTPNDDLEHPIILGLSGGFFDNRWFSRDPVAPRHALPRHDSGPRHGQEWYLRDEPA